ncbi:unnamed protein product [Candida verbasci]|uniref:UmuC domain-containing protein n=1 Tax=Candida verbasci TaxID=1227364 RepID=A0A9W4TR75_9ASCO|nr:unnamed protein product [Candida verbasci]
MSVKQPDESTKSPLKTTPLPASNFTYQNLYDLNFIEKSYLSPLAQISLIDLNAFFAQVEQVRLGVPDHLPLVCCQWHAIIAVNYPARKFGISRLDSVKSALEKCPDLYVAHAAVYRKGETHWAYQEGYPSVATHKVSLDTYRRESRKILRILQQHIDLVEKSSVDESYVDLGREVYNTLFDLFPEILNQDEEGNVKLPKIPDILPIKLQWKGVVIESLEEITPEGESLPPKIQDWDDICCLIGSMVIFDVRMAIYKELGYTTSAGVARNKLVSKLAGGFKKPDNQTIIRNSSICRFLSNFELTDITGMGGKLGDSLIDKLDVPADTNSITFTRERYDLEMLKDELKDDLELAEKVYHLVRGSWPTELSHQTEVKSMTSTKNFNIDYVRNLFDAYGWLTVFAGDLWNRLIDLDNENMELSLVKHSNKDKGNIRRPRTLTLGVFPVTGSRQTRQMPISFNKDLEKTKQIMVSCSHQLMREYLENNTNISLLNQRRTSKELFDMKQNPQLVKILSIKNMSLTISNFTVLNDNALIEAFAIKSNSNINDELIQINLQKRQQKASPTPSPKKQKQLSEEHKLHISKMFKEFEACKEIVQQQKKQPQKSKKQPSSNNFDIFKSLKKTNFLEELQSIKYCQKCKISIDDPIEHNDYHIAIDLSDKLNS